MKRLYAFVKEMQTVSALKSLTQEEYEAEMASGKYQMGIDVQEMSPLPEIGWVYQANCLQPVKVNGPVEVTTQDEKNDKTLRMVYAFSETNSQGIARICVKIPTSGRKIAYGDAEFETRKFGDIISKIEAADLERRLAWSIALSINPEATEPVADEMVQAMSREQLGGDIGPFPLYPTLDWYDERKLYPSEEAPFNEGTIGGGCTMTFTFGTTEVQPVGGYGNLSGDIYLVIEAKNILTARAAGEKCQFSIDWGEPNDS